MISFFRFRFYYYFSYWDIHDKVTIQGIEYSYWVEEHAVSYPRLDVLRPSITGVLSKKFPSLTLTVESEQPTELWFTGSAVIYAAITCQNSTTEGVDHMFFWVHTHLSEEDNRLNSYRLFLSYVLKWNQRVQFQILKKLNFGLITPNSTLDIMCTYCNNARHLQRFRMDF